MKKEFILLFCCIFLIFVFTASMVSADLIVPGTKSISYCFKISNVDEYPDYTFIVYFRNPVGGYEIIEQDECISFYKFSNPKIYAIKTSDFNEKDIGTNDIEEMDYFENNTKLIPSEIEIHSLSAVSLNDPVDGIADILEIISLDEDNLEIKYSKVQYTYFDKSTEELMYQEDDIRPEPQEKSIYPMFFWRFWYLILPLLAAVIIGLIVLIRKQKQTKK